jgi:hypothetical protein
MVEMDVTQDLEAVAVELVQAETAELLTPTQQEQELLYTVVMEPMELTRVTTERLD